ncbi:MAG: hypothetical protein DRN90_05595 [Thermoproteota archaeon]|nr:MAG: hypothetical protein DRN90_05595 [Candidatus Korarchaeota archaeon]
MGRKGAGTVLLVGFTIAVVILTIVVYLTPPKIKVQTGVQEDFIDTLSYMTSIMETASRLPGTTNEKADFINRSLASLSEYLFEKGISLTYSNFTVPIMGGGENVVILYTLSKGDSYFVGLLATNLTDIQKGIGLGRGGGSSPYGGEDSECVPVKSFPAFIVLYSGFPGGFGPHHGQGFAYGLRTIRFFIFNLEPTDYNLTMDLETEANLMVKKGFYINFKPFYMTRVYSLEDQVFYISARDRGITGLSFLHVRTLIYDEGTGQMYIEPESSYDEGCTGTYSIDVYITDDWEEYRELQIRAIREGIRNIFEWVKAGSDS